MTKRIDFENLPAENQARRIDRWFSAVRKRHADRMLCGPGCALCCHGLFDISLPDALRLSLGLCTLDAGSLAQVEDRALAIQHIIAGMIPGLKAPFFLDRAGEEIIDQVAERCGGERCPLLGPDDECLVYDCRPLACRLEGVPMVDRQDGLFGDWCELNFVVGATDAMLKDLELDYYEIQAVEMDTAVTLSGALPGNPATEATVFIASLITEYRAFWGPLVEWMRNSARFHEE